MLLSVDISLIYIDLMADPTNIARFNNFVVVGFDPGNTLYIMLLIAIKLKRENGFSYLAGN
jgi:hypothetical protein